MKLLVSLVVASLIVSQTFAGMTITSVTKTEGARKGGDKSATMRMKVDGDGVRIDWIEGHAPMGSAKGYMVTKDAGKSLYMVDPEKKEYVNASALTQMAAGFVSMTIKDHKIEKTLDEAGPTILGYPTRHCKFVTTYSMEMAVMGMKQTTSGKTEQEIWASPKVNVSAMAVLEKVFSQSMGGFGDLQKMIEAEKAKTLKGFPLKTIITSDTGTPDRPQVTKTITEVTEIKEGSVAASDFEVPKDYKETSMPGLGDAAEGDDKPAKSNRRPPPGLGGLLKNLAP